jgi:hypothetical protein
MGWRIGVAAGLGIAAIAVGVSCSKANSIACDRVRLAAWLHAGYG